MRHSLVIETQGPTIEQTISDIKHYKSLLRTQIAEETKRTVGDFIQTLESSIAATPQPRS